VEDQAAVSLVTYRRSGGGRPAFDEELEVEDDGAFRLVRRVSADRAGRFAGMLDPSARERLAAALAKLDDPVEIRPTRPGVVLELVDWAGGSASFPLEEELPPPWEAARELLQTLTEDLKTQPVAALEARLDDAAATLVLTAVGAQPSPVDFDGATVAVTLFDEEEEYVDSARPAFPRQGDGGQTLAPGWTVSIPLEHGLPFNPKRTLQLTLDLRIDDRDAQISVVAGKGWF
jgi:hypothetical protein